MITYEAPTRIESKNQALDNLVEAKPFLLNQLLVTEDFLLSNCIRVDFRAKYNKRPDLVAYEQYGIMEYYQVILFANNIGSLFQFTQENLNNQILVPKLEFLQNYLI
jgi:hypothetical protein